MLWTSDPLSSGPQEARIILDNFEELNTPKVAKLLTLLSGSKNVTGCFALEDVENFDGSSILSIIVNEGDEVPLCELSEEGVTEDILFRVEKWVKNYG